MITAKQVEHDLNAIRVEKRNYQLTFGSPAGAEVLRDLAKFCRATETTFHTDPRLHAALEGRREVWLRIQKQLGLTPEELFEARSGMPIHRIVEELKESENG